MIVYTISEYGITQFYLSDLLILYAKAHNITIELAKQIFDTYVITSVGRLLSSDREPVEHFMINPQTMKDILKQYHESLQ